MSNTVGDLKRLLAELPPEADSWPVKIEGCDCIEPWDGIPTQLVDKDDVKTLLLSQNSNWR